MVQHWLALLGPHLSSWQQFRHLLPIGVAGLVSWSVWLIRRTMSGLYRPVPRGYRTTTSVVVPAYREDPDILDRCLDSWLAEGPTEVIVVPDVEDIEVISRLQWRRDPRLVVIPFGATCWRVPLRATRSRSRWSAAHDAMGAPAPD